MQVLEGEQEHAVPCQALQDPEDRLDDTPSQLVGRDETGRLAVDTERVQPRGHAGHEDREVVGRAGR